MTNLVQLAENRIKSLGEAILRSLSEYKNIESDLAQKLANHNALLGGLEEAKNFLNACSAIADDVIPSPVAEETSNVAAPVDA